MNEFEHLFLTGEYRKRADLLSGLTLEQVTLQPDGASHSIYEELWHAAGTSAASSRAPRRQASTTRARRQSASSNGTTWFSSSWRARRQRSRWRKHRIDSRLK